MVPDKVPLNGCVFVCYPCIRVQWGQRIKILCSSVNIKYALSTSVIAVNEHIYIVQMMHSSE